MERRTTNICLLIAFIAVTGCNTLPDAMQTCNKGSADLTICAASEDSKIDFDAKTIASLLKRDKVSGTAAYFAYLYNLNQENDMENRRRFVSAMGKLGYDLNDMIASTRDHPPGCTGQTPDGAWRCVPAAAPLPPS